jgi:hypothetical protein
MGEEASPANNAFRIRWWEPTDDKNTVVDLTQ